MLRLPAEHFAELIREQPDFGMAVVAELGRRLREAEARIRDLQRSAPPHALVAIAEDLPSSIT